MTDPQRIADPDLPEAALNAIAEIAARQRAAGGLLMKLVTSAGGQIENRMEMLPDGMKTRLETAAGSALELAYRIAAQSQKKTDTRLSSDRVHLALATLSGGLGGLAGLGSALAELPVTTTVIFRAIQAIAAGHGFDPADPAVRAECLKVFASGGPQAGDDGVNTSFLAARVTLTGPALQRLIASVAPRFAALIGQKLVAQSVPIIGAVTGAGINYTFMDYFQASAHVRFGLMRLANAYGAEPVAAAFRMAASPQPELRG